MRKKLWYFLILISNITNAQSWHSVSDNVLCCGGESLGAYWGGLFACGGFTETQRVALWDGQKWDSIGFGNSAPVNAYEEYQGRMYFGGDFAEVGEWNQYPHTMSIVSWDGSNWIPVLDEYFGGRLNAMKVYNGELYVTGEGNFLEIDGVPAVKIAKWDGSQWSAVGNPSGLGLGLTRGECFEIYNNELIIGGRFFEAGGIQAYCIASWDGNEWDTLGSGLGVVVNDMVVDTVNNYLYAGGAFHVPGAVKSKNIARWDGTKWDSLGLGAPIDVNSLAMYNGKLYASPNARTGQPTDTILMAWDGQQWEYFQGFNSNIRDMEVYKNCLFVAGSFEQAPDGVQAKYIACYGEDCSEALGVLEVKNESKKFKIYPNPNTGEFTVAIEVKLQEDVEIRINDITGKIIYTSSLNKGQTVKDILINPMPSKGIYICSFSANGILLQTERITID